MINLQVIWIFLNMTNNNQLITQLFYMKNIHSLYLECVCCHCVYIKYYNCVMVYVGLQVFHNLCVNNENL